MHPEILIDFGILLNLIVGELSPNFGFKGRGILKDIHEVEV
jgi:hypothetical protein